MTEAYFIQHCDHELCDLGSFEYTCPVCDAYIRDYEIWWLQDAIMGGLIHPLTCEDCGAPLTVTWDREEYEYQVNGA